MTQWQNQPNILQGRSSGWFLTDKVSACCCRIPVCPVSTKLYIIMYYGYVSSTCYPGQPWKIICDSTRKWRMISYTCHTRNTVKTRRNNVMPHYSTTALLILVWLLKCHFFLATIMFWLEEKGRRLKEGELMHVSQALLSHYTYSNAPLIYLVSIHESSVFSSGELLVVCYSMKFINLINYHYFDSYYLPFKLNINLYSNKNYKHLLQMMSELLIFTKFILDQKYLVKQNIFFEIRNDWVLR